MVFIRQVLVLLPPLIAVKCHNAPLAELEEEFFGCNDKEKQSAGKLELSMGGTLFLDDRKVAFGDG